MASTHDERGLSMRRKYWVGGLLALLSLSLALWAGFGSTAGAATSGQKLTKVTLQLKWVTQAQFAGYYAAKAKGYYKQFGLDVNIKVGGPDITPEQVVASGQAQFGLDWLPSLLATRDTGTQLVNIAQVFTRSGMTELTWRDSGINTVAKMRDKTVGVWCCGNQFELFAALTKFGMDPEHNQGVKIFNQPFDMNAFLNRQIDAAAAMTYNELAQVLESKNPKTGKLYTLGDLNVINALIWPVRQGIGVMNRTSFARTAQIALKFKVIKKPASNAAYRIDLAKAADKLLAKQHVDVNGLKWRKSVVQVTPGG